MTGWDGRTNSALIEKQNIKSKGKLFFYPESIVKYWSFTSQKNHSNVIPISDYKGLEAKTNLYVFWCAETAKEICFFTSLTDFFKNIQHINSFIALYI